MEEEAVASDGTGFAPGQTSLYYQTRSDRLYQRWFTGVYAVGMLPLYILAWRFSYGPGSDAPYLNGLRQDARRFSKYKGRRKEWVMVADAGSDGKTVQEAT